MITDVEIVLSPNHLHSADHLRNETAIRCGVAMHEITAIVPLRRSLDARRFPAVYRLKVRVYVNEPVAEDRDLKAEQIEAFEQVKWHAASPQAVVVGAGPAGLFAAWTLLQQGIRPIIIEQGKAIADRKKDVAEINKGGDINPHSNWCFGEGGAGAFTDGKLYTRSSKRGDIHKILEILVANGADRSILIDAHAHIGTDQLPRIMQSMRHMIENYGGIYRFETVLSDLIIKNDRVVGIKTLSGEEILGVGVILATGHSARSIYELFAQKQWLMEAKPFAIGLRVEHPQELINKMQYRSKHYSALLPAATYSVVEKTANRQDVFSFCMCPGGMVVPAATQNGEIVVNGMSNSKRNSPFANAGMVVGISPEHIPSHMQQHGALGLLHFQREIEQQMFHLGGGQQRAPAQRLVDFCTAKRSNNLPKHSFSPGLTAASLHEAMPSCIKTPLQMAFKSMDKKMCGFYTNDAVVIGVESRTSSPVRLPRDRATLEHLQWKGLYPCGEGAGYAGGITSSAMDGMACATAMAQRHKGE